MATNHLEDLTDSYVDVSLAAMERDPECDFTNPTIKRIADLAIAEGNHYLPLPEYVGGAILFASDFEPEVTEGFNLREVVIRRSTQVSHYVFDTMSVQFLLKKSEIPVNPQSLRPVHGSHMPPVVWPHDEKAMLVQRDSGGDYNRSLLTRALHLDLVAEPEYEVAFLADTAQFLHEALFHGQPTRINRRTY